MGKWHQVWKVWEYDDMMTWWHAGLDWPALYHEGFTREIFCWLQRLFLIPTKDNLLMIAAKCRQSCWPGATFTANENFCREVFCLVNHTRNKSCGGWRHVTRARRSHPDEVREVSHGRVVQDSPCHPNSTNAFTPLLNFIFFPSKFIIMARQKWSIFFSRRIFLSTSSRKLAPVQMTARGGGGGGRGRGGYWEKRERRAERERWGEGQGGKVGEWEKNYLCWTLWCGLGVKDDVESS